MLVARGLRLVAVVLCTSFPHVNGFSKRKTIDCAVLSDSAVCKNGKQNYDKFTEETNRRLIEITNESMKTSKKDVEVLLYDFLKNSGFVTSDAQPSSKIKCGDANIGEYVFKPFNRLIFDREANRIFQDRSLKFSPAILSDMKNHIVSIEKNLFALSKSDTAGLLLGIHSVCEMALSEICTKQIPALEKGFEKNEKLGLPDTEQATWLARELKKLLNSTAKILSSSSFSASDLNKLRDIAFIVESINEAQANNAEFIYHWICETYMRTPGAVAQMAKE